MTQSGINVIKMMGDGFFAPFSQWEIVKMPACALFVITACDSVYVATGGDTSVVY